jgi:glycosidase
MAVVPDHKLIIYQLLPRLFGNTNTTNKYYGSIEENGCGKFNDINEKALAGIKNLGITHIFYTGIIEHATMTDHSQFGIKIDDPDVVKGRAGSPYAVKDYYDVDPDLAVDVANRMDEFEAMVKRTHDTGLKVLIDFIPNHVSRTYASDVKPEGIRDIGEDDDVSKNFDPKNDFYYIGGQAFQVPQGYNPGGDEFQSLLKDGRFEENPAKATGNDVFSASPSINDWFETVKLNYGVDYLDNHRTYFEPVPPLWEKLFDILDYWSKKGVDGFRCDMIEMVPVEFWAWLIPKLKAVYPDLVFIGEAYQVSQYGRYIFDGKFDYLYDKVGLYDGLKRLIRNEDQATTWDINSVWNHQCVNMDANMLRFLENHDEKRIANPVFAENAWLAVPGMIVTATLNVGPVMVYSGQEVGEPAGHSLGFSSDTRTSIFDYCGVPEHQKWLNKGKYDGGLLSEDQKNLRNLYSKLLNVTRNSDALRIGKFYELMMANQNQPWFNTRLYIYLRYTDNQRVLVVANFNRNEQHITVKLPDELLNQLKISGAVNFVDLLSDTRFSSNNIAEGVNITLPASSGLLLEF